MTLRTVCLCCILGLLVLPALAQDNPVTLKGAQDLLRASTPGAFSVRYMPDRALISSSTQQAAELRVYLPRKPLWGYLDKTRQALSFFGWDADPSLVVLKLEAGQHELQVGWAGTGEQPRQGQKIALLVDGKRVGQLTAHFRLEGMSAESTLQIPPATVRVWLVAREGADQPQATLAIGDAKVSQWQSAKGRLLGRGHVAVGGEVVVRLSVPGYDLLTSPIEAVEIEELTRPVDAVRVEKMPEDGILIEAEDFVSQGGGDVEISEGQHLEQHGGKSIFSFQGNGHWLEWEFEVPQAGRYDLFVKIACAEDMSFREVTVDRELPAPGFAMVIFPGTGGWAHAPGEWWYMQVAGSSNALPPLQLSKGKHTLRLKGVLPYHLNVDYFVLRQAK